MYLPIHIDIIKNKPLKIFESTDYWVCSPQDFSEALLCQGIAFISGTMKRYNIVVLFKLKNKKLHVFALLIIQIHRTHLPYFVAYMCVCGSVRPEINIGLCSAKTIHFIFLRQSLSLGCGFTNQAVLTSNSQPISTSLALVLQAQATMLAFLTWLWGQNSGPHT